MIIPICYGCSNYGAGQDEDFQLIKSELSKNLSVHSIELIDSDTLKVKLKSPFEENEDSFENLASIAFHLIGNQYRPNSLSLDKVVSIEMKDTLNQEFKGSLQFKHIFRHSKFLGRTLVILNSIIGTESPDQETAVQAFRKTECFKKLNDDDIIDANIVGLRKYNSGDLYAIALINGSQEYYLTLEFSGNNLDSIKCLN